MEKWKQLQSSLSDASVVTILRCFISARPDALRLIGFCDASTKAFAAVVYLRFESKSIVYVRFVAAKTRVDPQKPMTIPRLELLSALLLSRLIKSVCSALDSEFKLDDNTVCYTDSRVALWWIRGVNREWKQLVENHVISILSLVLYQHWRHCPGVSNLADIPSKEMSPQELSEHC